MRDDQRNVRHMTSPPEMLTGVIEASCGECRMKRNGTRRYERNKNSKRGSVGHYESLNDEVDWIASTFRSSVKSIVGAKCGLSDD